MLIRQEVAPRPVMHIRILKKAPYKVSYAEFSYVLQPVELAEENTSYIAARMVMPNGRLWEPLHEYELTRRFPTSTGAEEAWTDGFEVRKDLFLARAIMGRVIEEGGAEEVPAPSAALSEASPS